MHAVPRRVRAIAESERLARLAGQGDGNGALAEPVSRFLSRVPWSRPETHTGFA